MKNNIGLKIRVIREQKNISQIKLANDSKITAAYLCELENGAKSNPSFVVLQRLANALEVSVTELLDDNSKLVANK